MNWRRLSLVIKPFDNAQHAARVASQLGGQDRTPVQNLTDDERHAIAASKADASRGEFASDEDVAAVWAKRGF
jgi:hypothetical protein